MGKTKNTSGLLETMEENQNEVSNASGIKTGALESLRVSNEQKEVLENVENTINCDNE